MSRNDAALVAGIGNSLPCRLQSVLHSVHSSVVSQSNVNSSWLIMQNDVYIYIYIYIVLNSHVS